VENTAAIRMPWNSSQHVDEALVERGVDVTPLCTLDSHTVSATLDGVVPKRPYGAMPFRSTQKVLGISSLAHLFEASERFDLITIRPDFPGTRFFAVARRPRHHDPRKFSSDRICRMYREYQTLSLRSPSASRIVMPIFVTGERFIMESDRRLSAKPKNVG